MDAHHTGHHDHGHASGPTGHSVPDWDARYAESEQIWSGNPNQVLVAEVSELTPGRALDVGCGEGADAIWLAERGWQVIAIDVSTVAVDKARTAATTRGVAVDWQVVPMESMPLPDNGFDLVSAMYPVLPTANDVALRAVLSSVAAGGTLLFVHHAEFDADRARAHGVNPDDLLWVQDVKAALGSDWSIEVYEERDREVTHGAGAHHTRDLVLRARRG